MAWSYIDRGISCGHIEVENNRGKGSVFRVTLPAAASEAPVECEPDAGEEKSMPLPLPAVRWGSVLVVDDDAMIGATIRRIFCQDHDVTLATNGKEALELLRAGRRFDAILCDLMMPQMTGMDLFAELARTQPELCERIVFITGGAFTPAARAFLDRVPNRRVNKPFVPENLRTVVRGVMQID